MNSRAPLFLSVRYLLGRSQSSQTRRRLIGAVFGIAISLLPMLLVMQVSEGMIEGITRRYVEIGTFHIQLRSYLGAGEKPVEEIIEDVLEIDGVELAYSLIEGTTILYSGTAKSGAFVRGLPPDVLERDEGLRRYIEVLQGEFDLGNEKNILLSREVAKNLDLRAGDEVRLLIARSIPGRPLLLRPSTFTVAGVFTTGYRELDSLSVYISEDRGRRLFGDAGETVIAVKTEDPYDNLREILWNIDNRLPPGWYSYSWYNLERSMYKSLQTTQNLLIFIMALILIVASVNISSAVVMIVIERNREIAILKSIGAGPKMMTRTFLFVGLWVGIIGTIAGFLIGLLIVVNINEIIGLIEKVINALQEFGYRLGRNGDAEVLSGRKVLNPDYYLESIPVRLRYSRLAVLGAFSILLALGASFFPARKAGKMKPLDVFRKY